MTKETGDQATEGAGVPQSLQDARDAKIAKLALAWERALDELFGERAAA